MAISEHPPMQIALLLVTLFLAIALYRMLNSRRTTYPFVKVSRHYYDEAGDRTTTEHESGMVTIDQHVVIVDGNEYMLKATKESPATALLKTEGGKLVAIIITLTGGRVEYYIDPEYSVYNSAGYASRTGSKVHKVLSL